MFLCMCGYIKYTALDVNTDTHVEAWGTFLN